MRKFMMALVASSLVVPAAVTFTPTQAEAQQRRGQYREWRGRDGRMRCTRPDGTTGTLIGGAAGALVGNQVAGRGDKLLGTVVGGVLGGVAGREIDRGNQKRKYCR